jgi:hypothetical protein
MRSVIFSGTLTCTGTGDRLIERPKHNTAKEDTITYRTFTHLIVIRHEICFQRFRKVFRYNLNVDCEILTTYRTLLSSVSIWYQSILHPGTERADLWN